MPNISERIAHRETAQLAEQLFADTLETFDVSMLARTRGPFMPGETRRLRAVSALEAIVRDRLAAYAPNTQRALKADWTVWHTWCVEGRNHEDGEPSARLRPSPLYKATLAEAGRVARELVTVTIPK